MTGDYNILLKKLDSFIRKYYLNKIIRGSLFSVLIYLLYNFAIFFIEYFSYLSTSVRTILYFSSLLFFLIVFGNYILFPLLQFLKIGKRINYKQASSIISKHFSSVEDKLLNILELANDSQSNDLVVASIDQKINQLKPVPFLSAIQFKKNLVFLKYYIAFIVVLIPLLFFYPTAIVEGAERIINHSQVYEIKAPFDFIINTNNLKVKKGDNFSIELSLKGRVLPNDVEIVYSNYSFFMSKKNKNSFHYSFENINNDINFYFKAGEYNSTIYTLKVLPNPQILDFLLSAKPPAYTHISAFEQKNNGDVIVPEGTTIDWNISAIETDSVIIEFNDSLSYTLEKEDKSYIHTASLKKNTQYSFTVKNEYFTNSKVIDYTITVVPDLFPEISVLMVNDSLSLTNFYFKGIINDDYGFTALRFIYYQEDDQSKKVITPIQFNKNTTQQDFYFQFDFSSIDENKKIQYYFEVFDNDEINGYKSMKSSLYSYSLPSKEDLEKMKDEYDNDINKNLQSSKSLSTEIEKDIDDLRNKLLQENLSDWEKKELIQSIQEKHSDLKDMLKTASDKNKEKNMKVNSLSEKDKELLEKQKEIEDLLEKVMDPEMQKLLEDLQKLMEDFDKNKFFELSEEMKLSYDDLSEQLDKNLEMLKRFEIEQDVQKSIDELKKLAEEQEKLSEELKKKDSEIKENSFDSLQEKLQNIKEEYKETLEKNSNIDKPFKLEQFEQEFQKIDESMENSQQQQQDGKQKKSSESMENSSEETDSLASMMNSMMQANMQQQNMEDLDNLRQILDNLITFSFKQEKLMDELAPLSYNDPIFAEKSMEQNRLRENFEIINDSLKSLASRIPQINSQVNSEILNIRKDSEYAISALEQMQKSTALRRQQNIITSTNNLALLLSEIVEQLQKQAAQKMSGQQQCQNPSQGKDGKPSLSQMKQMQQSMKDQLQKMIEQMKESGSKPGQSGKGNKELGKMLAQQQQYREMISKMQKDGNFSPETMQQLKEISQMMERTENDIINKNITPQTMYRQDQIITRLLESEKAERERDLDVKRKSEEAKKIYANPKKYFENISEEKLKFSDRMNRSYLKLNSFYQKKYDQYLLNINNIE